MLAVVNKSLIVIVTALHINLINIDYIKTGKLTIIIICVIDIAD